MRTALACAALLALTACENRDRLSDDQASVEALPAENAEVVPESATAPQPNLPADPGKQLYRAIGGEPFWSLVVREGAILYQNNSDGTRLLEATPPGWKPGHGTLRSGRLTVTIAGGPCADELSGHVFRDRVSVNVASGSGARGCGGGLVEPPAVPEPELEAEPDPLAPGPAMSDTDQPDPVA